MLLCASEKWVVSCLDWRNGGIRWTIWGHIGVLNFLEGFPYDGKIICGFSHLPGLNLANLVIATVGLGFRVRAHCRVRAQAQQAGRQEFAEDCRAV